MHSGVCDNMASLKVELSENQWVFLNHLREMFPEMRARTLGYIGKEGKALLKKRFLSGVSGQGINLEQHPHDVLGRRTVSYSVGKKAKHALIASYPLNLFERGRKLRSGKKEKGKYIITRRFKQVMNNDLQKIVNEFDQMVLSKSFFTDTQDLFKNFGLRGL